MGKTGEGEGGGRGRSGVGYGGGGGGGVGGGWRRGNKGDGSIYQTKVFVESDPSCLWDCSVCLPSPATATDVSCDDGSNDDDEDDDESPSSRNTPSED